MKISDEYAYNMTMITSKTTPYFVHSSSNEFYHVCYSNCKLTGHSLAFRTDRDAAQSSLVPVQACTKQEGEQRPIDK